VQLKLQGGGIRGIAYAFQFPYGAVKAKMRLLLIAQPFISIPIWFDQGFGYDGSHLYFTIFQFHYGARKSQNLADFSAAPMLFHFPPLARLKLGAVKVYQKWLHGFQFHDGAIKGRSICVGN